MKSIKLVVLALIALAAVASAWTQDGIPRPVESVAQLETQAARDPKNPHLLQQLGTAYFYQARDGDVPVLEKAITTLERSIALAPDDAASQRVLGVAYLTKVGFLSHEEPFPPPRLSGRFRVRKRPFGEEPAFGSGCKRYLFSPSQPGRILFDYLSSQTSSIRRPL